MHRDKKNGYMEYNVHIKYNSASLPGRKEFVEHEKITPREQAFMDGWDQADELLKEVY
jgi:hypothetical protein